MFCVNKDWMLCLWGTKNKINYTQRSKRVLDIGELPTLSGAFGKIPIMCYQTWASQGGIFTNAVQMMTIPRLNACVFWVYMQTGLSWEFCFSHCQLPFFLLLTQSSWACSTLALQPLHFFINWVLYDALPFHTWLPTFLSGIFCCSFGFPLLFILLLFKANISRPLLFFPENALCSLWIPCVFYFVDIHSFFLTFVLPITIFRKDTKISEPFIFVNNHTCFHPS